MATQARAIATRQKVVRSAADVFSRSGFKEARLDDILGEAGVTRGAMYFHFDSKEELAQAVIDRQHEISMAAVKDIAESGAPALDQLVMVCHEMARQIVEVPEVGAGIRLTLEQSAVAGPVTPYQDWIDTCSALTEKAIQQGEVVETLDPAAFGAFVASAFTGVQLVANVLTGRRDLADRVDSMWRIVLPGIVSSTRHRPLDEIRAVRWRFGAVVRDEPGVAPKTGD